MQVDGAGQEGAGRHDHAPAARLMAGRDRLGDRGRAIGVAVADGAVVGDREVFVREGRHLDTGDDRVGLRPGVSGQGGMGRDAQARRQQ